MYSVVLMAAISAGSATTGWHHHGCYGCHGYHCGGYGWGYAYFEGNFCHGCYGCHGCWGCAGCSGISVYAPAACSGVFGCTGCYGCYGGWSCYGVPLPHHGYWHECPPAVVVPEKKGTEGQKIEETPLPKELKKTNILQDEARARVTIDVPADAKVYIDGQLTKSTSGRRVFVTPTLEPGQVYFYDLRVEFVQDGRTVVQTQRVLLHPGEVASAAFPNRNEDATATVQK